MKTRKDGRGKLNSILNADATAVVNGQQSLDNWDDEELLRGRRRNRKGHFRGPDPTLLPAEMVRELQRRRYSKAQALLAHSLVDAVKLLRAIVNDEKAKKGVRIRAAKEILNRVLGLPTEHVSLDVFMTEPWKKVIAEAIVPTIEDQKELPSGPARRCFYQTMAWSEEAAKARGGVMLVHWQRKLASCLASTLPDDMLDDVPLPVWEGPWMEEVKVS